MHAHEVPTHVQAEDRVLPRPPPLPSSLSNTTSRGAIAADQPTCSEDS